MMNSRKNDPDCDYVYKGTKIFKINSPSFIVVLSGEMGVGKSNIL